MNGEQFIIAYICNNSGRRGQVAGKKYASRWEAQEICDQLNEEYPNNTHYPTPFIDDNPRVKEVSISSKLRPSSSSIS